jgi:DnaJ-domain-containing protein 1
MHQAADFFCVIALAKQADLPSLYDSARLQNLVMTNAPSLLPHIKMLDKMMAHDGWDYALSPQWASFQHHFKGRDAMLRQAFALLAALASDADGYVDVDHALWLKNGAEILGLNYVQPLISETDPYHILGVCAGDSEADIQAAYHALIAQHHPDRWQHHGTIYAQRRAHAKAARLNAAYDAVMQSRNHESAA